MDAWLAIGASGLAVVAGLAALVRWMRRIARGFGDFMDDWRGEAARPGVPGRPGVMERLALISHRVAAIEHELHPNSGESVRDALDRVDRRTRRAIPTPDEE
ncbi:hypothetical protein [Streptomyces fuscichromogenes]|uniref:hypothetical protein n=1 Tax=Streptomyces fuscichromogenes TaxID=1324013 RepID=UPI001E62BD42|nr:hypothetical protein [Streptomyces fuscichromogenes]